METKEQRLRFADTTSLGSYANKEVITIGIMVDLIKEILSCAFASFLMSYTFL